MGQTHRRKLIFCAALVALFSLSLMSGILHGQDTATKPKGPPPVPVQVAPVFQDTVSEQITLVGTTEAIARSMVAAEVSGLVEDFPVREGDFVKKGEVLVRLTTTDVLIRLKAATATKEKVRANLIFAEKELVRYRELSDTDSIAARKYDEALYSQQSLEQELLGTEAQIELLKDEIQKKTVRAPFAGYVAKEHTQVGEWLPVGGPRELVTSVFGMMPLVLTPGAGSEFYRGLGSVVVGGLLVSTVFTIFLVPALLSLVLDLFEAAKRVFGRQPA